MEYWWISLVVIGAMLVIVLSGALVSFLLTFYSKNRVHPKADEYPTLEGHIYDPYRAKMVEWTKWLRALPHKDFSIMSEDGLRLCGKYYEYQKGAPIEILFHGYRGTAERDLCGGVHRCFRLGRNALIVDHRASGYSEGHVITFGVKESRDCLGWVELVLREIDKDAKIILTGVSMGAATVLVAATLPLPENVVGILADCGYSSPEAIIKKVMRDLHLSVKLFYPLARLGAILFGRFDPHKCSPVESMRSCRLPVLFFHGDDDRFVPISMSEENYAACASPHKRLMRTPKAGHGLCFFVDEEAYLGEVRDFFAPHL